MTGTVALTNLGNIANAMFNSITANSTAITALSVGGASINATAFPGTANNASNLGGTAAASYQLNSTLAANVATMTANNANNLGGTAAASYQLNSTLAANVATMTANNANNLGGTAAASYQLNSTLAANVATMTANNANNLGGTAASSYQLNSTLAANVATMAANSSTFANSSVSNTFTVGTAAYFVANGNVGIGNTAPASKLVVNGVTTSTGRVVVPAHTSNTGAATGVDLNAAGSGYLFGTTGDAASSTLANVKLSSWFGIGFSPSIGGQTVPQWENAAWIDVRSGAFSCRNNITAYASDERLKTNFSKIENSITKITNLNGYEFDWNIDKCKVLGFEPSQTHEHGFKAQEVQIVVPDAVAIAPFDDDGNKRSKSGENYLTVRYERLIPLLVEAIKEQQTQIESLLKEVKECKTIIQTLQQQ